MTKKLPGGIIRGNGRKMRYLMEQIVIQVKDKQKAQVLMDFLRALDFVETIASADQPVKRGKKPQKEMNFFSLAGLWAGRDISQEALRRKAWPE
jgi:hypothetical protein